MQLVFTEYDGEFVFRERFGANGTMTLHFACVRAARLRAS